MTGQTDPVELAAIHAESFTVPRPWGADEIAGTLTQPGSFLLTAADGFLIGRVIAGEAELLTLAVRPAGRRRGTGALLVGAFLDASRVQKAERAFLEVAADNAAARALYRRAGFSEAGRRRAYYRTPDGVAVDAIVMSLDLG
ncbi:ribosomal protein S18-alanine N-acetyltransferase [Defluviimonas sp. SAOS-178_SWC]|uniref:ribosomal protein S18-alanine N-acetyltransferase n=1 Tax=Defluviimonas sp. SAOS-178_SWC TaxID=3121287 RepID=UPI00322159DE